MQQAAEHTIAAQCYQVIAAPAGIPAVAAYENTEAILSASHHSGRAERNMRRRVKTGSTAAQHKQASGMETGRAPPKRHCGELPKCALARAL